MNLVLEDVRTPHKVYGDSHTPNRFLSLEEYLNLARRMIGKFAPLSFRGLMLQDEDAIDYVAHKMMRADWEYDINREVKPATWRGYRAKKAIKRYIINYHKSNNERLISIDSGLELVSINSNHHDANDLLDSMLQILTSPQRTCIQLHFIDGYTPSEIATKLSITRQAVRKMIDRSLLILMKQAKTL